jgi:hypothetical protein
MENIRTSSMTLSVLHIVGVLLTSMAVGGCSKPPPALSEEELLRLLAAAKREGPYQFQRQTWPRLEKKTIRYCGSLDESKVVGANSVLLLKVDKEYAGEKLPWSLEGKSDSPAVAQTHTAGEAVCLTGVLESFMERNNMYWGYVTIVSVEKSATS